MHRAILRGNDDDVRGARDNLAGIDRPALTRPADASAPNPNSGDPMIPTPKVAHRPVEGHGLDVFYREAGPQDAPAVLLLHGFPTSSQMFRNLFPSLADRYHVLAPDYPGFGHSSMPPRHEFAYTFDNLAAV